MTGEKPFRIGEWTIRPDLNRFVRGDETIQVEPRLTEVLVILARRAGEVVSREELLDAVWGDTVVNEESLTRAVSDIRQILGDDSRSPRFIETIRQGGYRMIAPVSREVETAGSCGPTCWVEPPRPGRDRTVLTSVVVAAVIVTTAAVLLVMERGRRAEPVPTTAMMGTPLTSYTGSEALPAFSPDGSRIAFCRDGEGESYDLYVMLPGGESALRLTDDPAHDLFPCWSPDGTSIAFARWSEKPGIYTVPSIGGPLRLLARTATCPYGLDWSAGGESIVYAGNESGEGPHKLYLLSLETLEAAPLTEAPEGFVGDYTPVFSPEGERIAFRRSDDALIADLYVVAAAGGEPRRITRGQRRIAGLAWSDDGREIVFSASPSTEYGLWRVPADGGEPRWIPTRGHRSLHPSVARNGRGLVYEEHVLDRDIWCARLPEEPGGEVETAPWITSTRNDFSASYSPDGGRIVFLSNRSGHPEIWICAASGEAPRRITEFAGAHLVNPLFSPDGRRIAFSASRDGKMEVYVVDVEGGAPRRVRRSDRHEEFTRWSADGRWLYFYAFGGEEWEIGRISVDDGRVEKVTAPGCRLLHVPVDGESFYYYRPPENGIWEHRLDGSEGRLLIDPAFSMAWAGIAFTGDGVFFTEHRTGGSVLGRMRFAGGETDSLTFLDGLSGNLLALSPDGRSILYARTERDDCDLVYVKGFE